MPLYKFRCTDCDKPFDIFLSLGELNRGVAYCPDCKGTNLEGPLPDETAAAPALACSIGKKS